MAALTPMIDLHCDTLCEIHRRQIGLMNRELHISLDKRPKDYQICQAMAIFVPDTLRGPAAEAHFWAVYHYFMGQVRQYSNDFGWIADLNLLNQPMEKPFTGFLTIEGGAALAGKLDNVERFYQAGVRMMTLTWNAANELCGGVETDLGFTAFGRAVVAEMERLGMVVDVSHLSDRAFWELCGFAQKPFVASHSNARGVCDHPRNLTDEMFCAIRDRGGLVGLNYYNDFIVEAGNSRQIDDLLAHITHFLALDGADTLALGSDFDGAEIPTYLDGLEKVGNLFAAMEKAGLGTEIIEKIRCTNAKNFFARVA